MISEQKREIESQRDEIEAQRDQMQEQGSTKPFDYSGCRLYRSWGTRSLYEYVGNLIAQWVDWEPVLQ